MSTKYRCIHRHLRFQGELQGCGHLRLEQQHGRRLPVEGSAWRRLPLTFQAGDIAISSNLAGRLFASPQTVRRKLSRVRELFRIAFAHRAPNR